MSDVSDGGADDGGGGDVYVPDSDDEFKPAAKQEVIKQESSAAESSNPALLRLKNMGLTIMPTSEISTKQRLETIKKEVKYQPITLPPPPPVAKSRKVKRRRKVLMDDDTDSDDSRDEDFVPGGVTPKKKKKKIKMESGVTITPTSDPPLVQSSTQGVGQLPPPKIGFKCRACLIAYSTRELMQKCMAGHRQHINMDEEVTCPKCEEKIQSR